jgi:toxin ParE1/3/4
MKILWSEQALKRLEEIHQFVAERASIETANKLIDNLIKRAETLANFPYMGRVVPEFHSDDLREIIEGNYRIVYIFQKNTLIILTVFEGHRLFPKTDLSIN